jgi:magnesium transporter
MKALEEYSNKSKKPQVRMLDTHVFTLMLDMKYSDAQTLVTEGIYIFLGRGWLVTIHSSTVDLTSIVKRILEEKNRPLLESSVDALYYSILSSIVDKYEQILTAIELSVADMEQRSVYKRPSKQMLEHLDDLSRQIIVLRRHFWHIRDVINFLIHVQEERPDIKYLKIVYDDINQLIELVESYQDDLNNIWRVPFGFVLVMILMAAAAAALFAFLKAKQWILVREDTKRINKKKQDKPVQH